MDKKQILQWLIPAVSAGAILVLIGILIALSDFGPSPSTAPTRTGNTPLPPASAVSGDASGMSPATPAGLPPVDAPEWKAGPGAMKIWDVVEGSGDPCPRHAEVTIHYIGWLLNGKVFDSSVNQGTPSTFALDVLIRGWQEGIPGMKPGGIRRLYIPYDWAYGEAGSPGAIPPRSDLIFEVKLLGFR